MFERDRTRQEAQQIRRRVSPRRRLMMLRNQEIDMLTSQCNFRCFLAKLHTSNAASQHPASIRSSAFSPSPQPLSPQFSKNTISPANNPVFQASRNPRYQLNMQQISSAQASRGVAVTAPSNNKGRMSVGVDFGTMFSSVSYGSSRIASGTVQQILIWPGASENFRKIPTCLLYDEGGRVAAWGLEAKYASPTPGTIRCEWCVDCI